MTKVYESYTKQILELLQKKKTVTCPELIKITHRFGAAIHRLRHVYGHNIVLKKEWKKKLFRKHPVMHTSYELIS